MIADVLTLIDRVIGKEGGYSDHPADRGGATMWGVTEQVARAYGYKGGMRALPRATAVEIYKRRYWDAVGLGQVVAIAPDLAAELFDIAVNMGTAWPGRFLQRALNALNRGATDYPDIPVDSVVGAMTLASLRDFEEKRGAPGLIVLLKAVMALRAVRYIEIAEANPSQEVFLFGWLANRTFAGQFQ